MSRKKKLDFVLFENEYEKITFRFYPRRSHCHSFGDEPPKSWDEVYKVYYSYSIIKHYKGEELKSYVMFESDCDECSAIDEVAFSCEQIANGITSVTRTWNDKEYVIELLNKEIKSHGYGVSWKIADFVGYKDIVMYKIEMFNWDNVGYRFYLDGGKLKEFGKYLQNCCDYMLAHGEPI